jgi:hypothetical protein
MGSTEGEANCGLHPLIHTPLEFNLAQNAVGGQFNAVGKITPSRLSLNG